MSKQATMVKVEVFVLVDSNGDSWVSNDVETLDEDHEAVHPTRLLRAIISVPAPELVELACVVPVEVMPDVPVKMEVTG